MTREAYMFFEEIANGRVPAPDSVEAQAYNKEFKARDYTWAIQTFQAIRDEVGRGSFADWDVATMKEMQ